MRHGKEEQLQGASVTVRVDVTKIVRYLCFTGVLVVGIIFGTRCWREIKESLEQ